MNSTTNHPAALHELDAVAALHELDAVAALPELGDESTMDFLRSSVPHLDQYAGVWAIHEPAFSLALHHASCMDFREHVARHTAAAEGRSAFSASMFEMAAGGVAVIQIEGIFTKHGSSMSENPGTIQLRRAVRAAVADRSVLAIMLHIDSPGGSTAGLDDLAQEVRRAAARKPVLAFIEDLGASAAYFIASQATHVFANRGALIGAIGTFAVIQDFSEMFEKKGITTHVVRTGEMKGLGARGAEVTPEHLAEIQRTMEQINDLFVAAVVSGRGMNESQVRLLADGRVHIASEALALGLIDSVATADEAIDFLRKEQQTMAETKSEAAPPVVADVAATLAELKKELPDSDAAFREECQESGATVAEAKDFWIATLGKRLDEKDAELATAKTDAAAAAAAVPPQKRSGVSPIPTSTTVSDAAQTGDPIARWQALVEKHKAGGRDNAAASRLANMEDPDLRKASVVAHNEAHPRRERD